MNDLTFVVHLIKNNAVKMSRFFLELSDNNNALKYMDGSIDLFNLTTESSGLH